jgi:hypothetical protein
VPPRCHRGARERRPGRRCDRVAAAGNRISPGAAIDADAPYLGSFVVYLGATPSPVGVDVVAAKQTVRTHDLEKPRDGLQASPRRGHERLEGVVIERWFVTRVIVARGDIGST